MTDRLFIRHKKLQEARPLFERRGKDTFDVDPAELGDLLEWMSLCVARAFEDHDREPSPPSPFELVAEHELKPPRSDRTVPPTS